MLDENWIVNIREIASTTNSNQVEVSDDIEVLTETSATQQRTTILCGVDESRCEEASPASPERSHECASDTITENENEHVGKGDQISETQCQMQRQLAII